MPSSPVKRSSIVVRYALPRSSCGDSSSCIQGCRSVASTQSCRSIASTQETVKALSHCHRLGHHCLTHAQDLLPHREVLTHALQEQFLNVCTFGRGSNQRFHVSGSMPQVLQNVLQVDPKVCNVLQNIITLVQPPTFNKDQVQVVKATQSAAKWRETLPRGTHVFS